MQRFLSKLKEILRLKVKDAELSEADFNEAVRQARAHAGGMARWEKAKEIAGSITASEGHTGLMVGYWLPETIAQAMTQKGGEPASDLHLTMCYCGDVQSLGDIAVARALVAVENLARCTPPLVGSISGTGRFNTSNTSNGKDVFYASVDMPQLAEFRQRLAEALKASGCPARMDHGYTPHITLAYLEPEEDMPDFDIDSVTLRIPHITFVAGDKRIDMPLAGRDEMYFSEVRQFVYDRLEDLPDAVKDNLPTDAQRIWMAAFNNSIKDRDEGKAIRIAWGAIKRAGWKQTDGKWVKASETPPEAILAALEASEMNPFKLLGEVALSEDGSRVEVQIFPAVGKYSHPRYGELDISKDFLKAVKKNFDGRIYQQELPLSIDLEHQSTLSGAAGWIDSLEIRGDKGMWATIPLNDRGKELCSKDAYRYFSPEFYDSWQDPATNKRYNNVLIGGALTNRPFFKGMQAVAMMSEGAVGLGGFAAAEDDMDIEEMMSKMKSIMERMEMSGEDKTFMYDVMDKMKKMPGKMKAAAETSGDDASADPVDRGLADKPTGGESMGMTEEEARQFKEMGDSMKSLTERLATEEAARKAAESEAKQAAERVAALERTANRKALSEFVRGNRMSFQGEVEECVDKLEKMQAKLGEDFNEYLDEKRSLHDRIQASPMFEQVSRTNAGGNGVTAEFEAAKRKLMSEDAKLSEAEATVRVASENPALYKRYDDAFKRNIKRGGD